MGADLPTTGTAKQFRLHLRRGISYLVGTEDTKTLSGLISLATQR